MKTDLRRLTVLKSLTAALTLAGAASVQAQQTGAPKRPQGPIAGPTITLPAGSGEALAEPDASHTQRESDKQIAPAPRWEYCAIVSVYMMQKDRWSPVTGLANIRYFSGGGTERVEGGDLEEALANAMTKLGEDGWELVAIRESISINESGGQSSGTYFFKRPKTATR